MSNFKQDAAEDDDLLKMMEGDEFISEEERQKREAECRRLERKRRLQSAEEPPPVAIKRENQDDASNVVGSNPDRNGEDRLEDGKLGSKREMVKEVVDANDKDDDDDDDGFDMFSSSVSPVATKDDTNSKAATAGGSTQVGTQQDWDDAEGYYKAVIGEIIQVGGTSAKNRTNDDGAADLSGDISFRVSGVIGKGVFSSVLKCTTTSNSTSVMLPPVVAIKCVRHNETMAKAANTEIQFLQRLKNSPGIVPLLLPTSSTPLEHRGHVLLVFPCADYNLRDVLQKFGKGVGLSLEAVRSYFGQLLAAATHLKKHSIIHSDLKPDNILVSKDFSCVQLGDLGSALDVSTSSQQPQPTPYLVSRFYRAPEIILGLVPTFAVDLWSLAVTVAEIFLGQVVFQGKTNNDMLLEFMKHLGPFSNRVIRQHLVQCQRMPIPPHFTQRKDSVGSDYLFTQHTVDPVSGKPVNKYVSLVSNAGNSSGDNQAFPSIPLSKKLLKAKSAKDSRTMVVRFSDLLQKCLALDPSRRISLKDSLQHDFFTKGVVATKGDSIGHSK